MGRYNLDKEQLKLAKESVVFNEIVHHLNNNPTDQQVLKMFTELCVLIEHLQNNQKKILDVLLHKK